jgi:hypothetical protein
MQTHELLDHGVCRRETARRGNQDVVRFELCQLRSEYSSDALDYFTAYHCVPRIVRILQPIFARQQGLAVHQLDAAIVEAAL